MNGQEQTSGLHLTEGRTRDEDHARLVAVAADWRYSDEYVGTRFREYLRTHYGINPYSQLGPGQDLPYAGRPSVDALLSEGGTAGAEVSPAETKSLLSGGRGDTT